MAAMAAPPVDTPAAVTPTVTPGTTPSVTASAATAPAVDRPTGIADGRLGEGSTEVPDPSPGVLVLPPSSIGSAGTVVAVPAVRAPPPPSPVSAAASAWLRGSAFAACGVVLAVFLC